MRSIGFDSFSNPNLSSVSFVSINFFSRDEATLYEGVSVGPSDGNQFFFGLLGATYAVYTALFVYKKFSFLIVARSIIIFYLNFYLLYFSVSGLGQ